MTQFMESGNPSIQLVQQGYQAFTNGDMEGLSKLMSADVTHTVPGNHPLSGKYQGIDEVLELYGQLFNLTNSNLNINLQDLTPGPNNQVLVTHQFVANSGNWNLDVIENLVFTVEDGKITSISESSPDQQKIDEFWSQVSQQNN